MKLIRWLGTGKQQLSAPAVAVLGNFDGVHLGHQALLQQAIAIAERDNLLPVAISFYPPPSQILLDLKQHLTLTTWEQRLHLFSKFGMEETLLIRFTKSFSQQRAHSFLKELYQANIRHLVIGPYACIGKDREGTPDVIKQVFNELGGSVTVVESIVRGVDTQRISSSQIRSSLLSGQLLLVEESLGRPYSVVGRVMTGKKLGRTIGFPTANLAAIHTTLPPVGVYASSVLFEGKEYVSMTNVGTRPTVTSSSAIHVETHILDFSETIYGKKLELFFQEKIRDEKKFESIDALKTQLAADLQFVKDRAFKP